MRKNHRIFTEWILLAAFIIVPVIYILVGIIGSISELKTWNSDHEDDSYNENCFSYDDYMEYGDSMYDIGKEYGYEKGKEEGYKEGIESGYETGYEDGSMSDDAVFFAEEEATRYARENSDWHPEEAIEIIDAYQNGDPFYEDNSPPSEQDYVDAVDSIVAFYEYFYCR